MLLTYWPCNPSTDSSEKNSPTSLMKNTTLITKTKLSTTKSTGKPEAWAFNKINPNVSKNQLKNLHSLSALISKKTKVKKMNSKTFKWSLNTLNPVSPICSHWRPNNTISLIICQNKSKLKPTCEVSSLIGW